MYLAIPYRCRCGKLSFSPKETLVNLAKPWLPRVKRNRQKVSLEPIDAFERKIIHTALQGDKNVITNSEGTNRSVTL